MSASSLSTESITSEIKANIEKYVEVYGNQFVASIDSTNTTNYSGAFFDLRCKLVAELKRSEEGSSVHQLLSELFLLHKSLEKLDEIEQEMHDKTADENRVQKLSKYSVFARYVPKEKLDKFVSEVVPALVEESAINYLLAAAENMIKGQEQSTLQDYQAVVAETFCKPRNFEKVDRKGVNMVSHILKNQLLQDYEDREDLWENKQYLCNFYGEDARCYLESCGVEVEARSPESAAWLARASAIRPSREVPSVPESAAAAEAKE